MTARLDIEFVSDIACPWCYIGLANLEAALASLDGEVEADLRLAAFELNPDMPAQGMDRATYFAEKYGLAPEEAKSHGRALLGEADKAGIEIDIGPDFRLRNTFDAHRLLEWALDTGGREAQLALKKALFAAHFGAGRDIADTGELARIAGDAGLDGEAAGDMLAGEAFAEGVRRLEAAHRERDIFAVPTILVEGRYRINGNHPPERFAKALRHIAGELAAAA